VGGGEGWRGDWERGGVFRGVFTSKKRPYVLMEGEKVRGD